MNDIEKLLRVFDAYVAATDSAEATVSARFLGRGGRIADLKRGGDMGSRTIQRALDLFSAQWPAAAAWPDGVGRPAPSPGKDAA